jgi:hypothetical protein
MASVTPRFDTTAVSYIITTQSGSSEALVRFSIDAPGGVVRILVPSPPPGWEGLGSNWIGLTEFQGRSMAHWISADSFPAGVSTPELNYESVGVPGILSYWAGGGFTFPSLEEDTVPDTNPLETEMVTGRTVGVEPWPVDRTPSSLLLRLRSLTQMSCAAPLFWITSATLCTQLLTYLDEAEAYRAAGQADQAKASLTTFAGALGSPPGAYASGVTNSAYWLLKPNADIIRGSL